MNSFTTVQCIASNFNGQDSYKIDLTLNVSRPIREGESDLPF